MAASLDLGGILLLAGTVAVILGLLLAIYRHSRKVYGGFGYWVLADLSIGLSFILVGASGFGEKIPSFVLLILGNVLTVYSLILLYEGVQTFFGRPRAVVLNYSGLGLFVLLEWYWTYLAPNPNARIALTSAFFVLLGIRLAHALLTGVPLRLLSTARIIALTFILISLFVAMRGVFVFLQRGPVSALSDPTLLALAFAASCSIVVLNLYFIFLNGARVEGDLEEARAKLALAADTSRRDLAQLALLDEAGRLISQSLNEAEVRQSAVDAIVSRFGYAEAAICMLLEGDKLELAALSGTEDIGYRPGYRQSIGEGIIGHVAETGKIYVSPDVEHDPYYFTIGARSGSAAAVPMLNQDQLLGVLYVESTARNAFDDGDVRMLRTLSAHVVTAINKARLHAETRDHLIIMTTLHRISQIITSSLELDHIFENVLQLLKATFGYTHISIYLLDENVLHLGAQIGYLSELALAEIPVNEGIIGRSVQTKQLQFVRDVRKDPDYLAASSDIGSEICVPLLKKGAVLGVVNVEAAPGQPLTDRDAEVLTALAGPVSIAIENAHLHAQAKSLARTDGLTGLMNRRTFDQVFASELARAARYDCPLTLIIVDIDDFKASNDRWGHPAGDSVLRATGALIRENIRSSDSAARYGGDEFAIILPNTALSDGLELAERLRLAIQDLGRRVDVQGVPLGDYTISLGVATFPEHGGTADELLLAADHAELNAKKFGKNRVCSASVEG